MYSEGSKGWMRVQHLLSQSTTNYKHIAFIVKKLSTEWQAWLTLHRHNAQTLNTSTWMKILNNTDSYMFSVLPRGCLITVRTWAFAFCRQPPIVIIILKALPIHSYFTTSGYWLYTHLLLGNHDDDDDERMSIWTNHVLSEGQSSFSTPDSLSAKAIIKVWNFSTRHPKQQESILFYLSFSL